MPTDEGHIARCAKHFGAAFGSARYDCLERGLRYFATKAQVDRTRLRLGQDRGPHAPGYGAWLEEALSSWLKMVCAIWAS